MLGSACQFLLKKTCWDFGRYCFESIDQFGRIAILMLHLPIHKHRLSLHLFWSSSLSAMFYSLGLCLTLLLLKLFLSILFFLLLWMELFSLEPVCLNIILYCWGERKSQGWFLRFPGWVVGGIVEPPFDKKNSGEGADLGFVRKWHVREVEFEE